MPLQKEEQKSSTSLALPPTSFKLTHLISTVNISEFNGFIGLRLTGQILYKATWENNKDTNDAQTETELNLFTVLLFRIIQCYTAWDFQNHLTSPWAVKAARVSTAEQRWMPSEQTWELLREEDEFGEQSYEKLDCLLRRPT